MSKDEKQANLARLASELVDGLNKEREAIQVIKSQVDLQLNALRAQNRLLVEDTTLKTSQEVNTLQKLRNQREAIIGEMAAELQIDESRTGLTSLVIALASELPNKSLKSKLATLATELPEEAAAVKDSCKELAYSLQYALHLGQSMIEAVHGATSPPPVQVYTATGNKKLSPSKRMMVNKVG